VLGADLAEPLTALPTRDLPPRLRGILANHAMNRAAELVVMVRDEGTDAIGAFLDRCDRQGLYALVVTLAAMVPDDAPMDELLAWITAATEGVAA
jgi:hypothetical protein